MSFEQKKIKIVQLFQEVEQIRTLAKTELEQTEEIKNKLPEGFTKKRPLESDRNNIKETFDDSEEDEEIKHKNAYYHLEKARTRYERNLTDEIADEILSLLTKSLYIYKKTVLSLKNNKINFFVSIIEEEMKKIQKSKSQTDDYDILLSDEKLLKLKKDIKEDLENKRNIDTTIYKFIDLKYRNIRMTTYYDPSNVNLYEELKKIYDRFFLESQNLFKYFDIIKSKIRNFYQELFNKSKPEEIKIDEQEANLNEYIYKNALLAKEKNYFAKIASLNKTQDSMKKIQIFLLTLNIITSVVITFIFVKKRKMMNKKV
ncbi:hypothetical protein ['Camptotheca acuminata' phytoplasma]|uniref:hypothetical protein n=1 Tax='Camptotheca acuminata' phytoplasma TaxID=3239192 RepID=UPI00351A3409